MTCNSPTFQITPVHSFHLLTTIVLIDFIYIMLFDIKYSHVYNHLEKSVISLPPPTHSRPFLLPDCLIPFVYVV